MEIFPWLSNIYRWRIYLWNVSYAFRKTAHSSKQCVSVSGEAVLTLRDMTSDAQMPWHLTHRRHDTCQTCDIWRTTCQTCDIWRTTCQTCDIWRTDAMAHAKPVTSDTQTPLTHAKPVTSDAQTPLTHAKPVTSDAPHAKPVTSDAPHAKPVTSDAQTPWHMPNLWHLTHRRHWHMPNLWHLTHRRHWHMPNLWHLTHHMPNLWHLTHHMPNLWHKPVTSDAPHAKPVT